MLENRKHNSEINLKTKSGILGKGIREDQVDVLELVLNVDVKIIWRGMHALLQVPRWCLDACATCFCVCLLVTLPYHKLTALYYNSTYRFITFILAHALKF